MPPVYSLAYEGTPSFTQIAIFAEKYSGTIWPSHRQVAASGAGIIEIVTYENDRTDKGRDKVRDKAWSIRLTQSIWSIRSLSLSAGVVFAKASQPVTRSKKLFLAEASADAKASTFADTATVDETADRRKPHEWKSDFLNPEPRTLTPKFQARQS